MPFNDIERVRRKAMEDEGFDPDQKDSLHSAIYKRNTLDETRGNLGNILERLLTYAGNTGEALGPVSGGAGYGVGRAAKGAASIVKDLGSSQRGAIEIKALLEALQPALARIAGGVARGRLNTSQKDLLQTANMKLLERGELPDDTPDVTRRLLSIGRGAMKNEARDARVIRPIHEGKERIQASMESLDAPVGPNTAVTGKDRLSGNINPQRDPRAAAVEKVLPTLDPKEAELVRQVLVYGQDVTEAAAKIGIPKGGADEAMKRAVGNVQAALEGRPLTAPPSAQRTGRRAIQRPISGGSAGQPVEDIATEGQRNFLRDMMNPQRAWKEPDPETVRQLQARQNLGDPQHDMHGDEGRALSAWSKSDEGRRASRAYSDSAEVRDAAGNFSYNEAGEHVSGMPMYNSYIDPRTELPSKLNSRPIMDIKVEGWGR